MSDNIPFDLQTQIIKRVFAVKSLARFRSVSKQWKSLIDSPEFITHHLTLNHTHPHHLLVRYELDSHVKYVSIIDDDDDSFPQNKFHCAVPWTLKLFSYSALILGCSHGLVCLYGFTDEPDDRILIVVWNPSIGKSFGVTLVPSVYADIIGFGVCPKTCEPKIVRITRPFRADPRLVEVFTLSSGTWRKLSGNPPCKSYDFSRRHVVTDGVIHWLSSGLIPPKIITFDLTNEEFGGVDLPDSLVARSVSLDISKLNESLVVLNYYADDGGNECYDVWMMKIDVPKSSFTKLFTLKVEFHSIIGFRKNGQPVIMGRTCSGDREIEVYELGSGHRNGLGIYGSGFNMLSYTESLLLLNHSDSIYHS